MSDGRILAFATTSNKKKMFDLLQNSVDNLKASEKEFVNINKQRPEKIRQLEQKILRSEASIVQAQKLHDSLVEPQPPKQRDGENLNSFTIRFQKYPSDLSNYKTDRWAFEQSVLHSKDAIADNRRMIENLQNNDPQMVSELLTEIKTICENFMKEVEENV